MKSFSSFLLGAAATLISATSALAQITLTGFAPYTQNFNTLPTSTAQASFVNNSTLPGVYAQAMLTGFGAYPGGTTPVPYYGNDGAQNTDANYYSFGTAGSTDRSLGGIATTFIANGYPLTGTGYVAMRFKNQTGRPIANLEVNYAMEQWYNSGKIDKAQVGFDYQVMSVNSAFTGAMETGAWTSVPALGVAAPSTATTIASKNGNAAANRRVLTSTLQNLNLAVGQEVVLRWKYVLNSDTNGNGLSIDDVTVTPQAGAVTTGGVTQANIFYYDGSGSLSDVNNWVSQPGQTRPLSFKTADQVFYITTATGQPNLDGNLISGTNSKLVIGNGQNAVSVAMTTNKKDVLPTTINVAAGATLELNGKDGLLPTFGNLSPGSTVYFNTTRTDVVLRCANFGNLTLNGTQAILGRNVSVSNTLSLTNNSQLKLSVYDLTILKGGVATSDGTAYVNTNTGGALRQTVSPNNVAVLFPVGQGTYNPTWLSQTTTAIEDVFGVSVSDSVYTSYATTTTGPGNNDDKGKGKDSAGKGKPSKSTTTTEHTWYISEDDLGNSNVTVQLQSDLPTSMDPTQVMVGHYHGGTWENDTQQKGKGAAVNAANRVYRFTRTGITGFSPFTLATTPGPLPVELVSFTASRQAATVACTWATASELHNDHFVLERSLDGVAFSPLATVAGAGSSTSTHTYRWVDTAPARTLAYYRLRQVDTDGTTSFSPVVTVSGLAEAASPLLASPNPTAGPFVLTLTLPEATTLRGTVLSVVGTEVLHVEQALAAGTQALPLDLSTLPTGVYLLRLEMPQGLQTLRVVKN